MIKKTITHMNSQNHSCLLPQRTSDIRNLEERKGLRMRERVGEVRMGRGEDDGRGMMKIKFKATEKQTQQMRQQQTHE